MGGECSQYCTICATNTIHILFSVWLSVFSKNIEVIVIENSLTFFERQAAKPDTVTNRASLVKWVLVAITERRAVSGYSLPLLFIHTYYSLKVDCSLSPIFSVGFSRLVRFGRTPAILVCQYFRSSPQVAFAVINQDGGSSIEAYSTSLENPTEKYGTVNSLLWQRSCVYCTLPPTETISWLMRVKGLFWPAAHFESSLSTPFLLIEVCLAHGLQTVFLNRLNVMVILANPLSHSRHLLPSHLMQFLPQSVKKTWINSTQCLGTWIIVF